VTAIDIQLPPKLIPIFAGQARYRCCFGGRGSAKTRSFAKMAAVRGVIEASKGNSGIILCCREFMNSLDESSMAEVKAAIASEPWLTDMYEVGQKFIRTRCGRVEFKFSGLRHNLDSIKSKARILLCWVDEAEAVSESAWVKLVPTVREEGSEIWVTWNPESERSPTHKRFRASQSDDMKIVEMNWTDNPWFPDVLELERQRDLRDRPDQYEHIWEGAFATVIEGAYYADALWLAEKEGRLSPLNADRLMTIRTYHDIGGAGATADAYTIWVVQFINKEIRVLDYYETVGQTLDYHVTWMRNRGYENAHVILPHDGTNANSVTGKRYEDHWRDAGFTVRVVKNQGKGAAMQRVQAVRRLFPQIWIDPAKCDAGLEALRNYHEKRDDKREVGLGPNHNWASHAADAFGLMAIDYNETLGSLSYHQNRPMVAQTDYNMFG
jgi:phage terminase large subunit